MDMVGQTNRLVCWEWSTDDEVEYSLRRVTSSLKQKNLSVDAWFNGLGWSVCRLYETV